MPDLAQFYGNDLAVGPGGDLATVDTTQLGQQRVLRRLLTNPGDYLWNPSYGAGLAQFVGLPVNAARIASVIRSQIFQEPAVAPSPAPLIAVAAGASGTVAVQISYADSTTGETQVLSFSVGAV
jgi:phage baseplate assembly protein W